MREICRDRVDRCSAGRRVRRRDTLVSKRKGR
jgi:hypothetical protein